MREICHQELRDNTEKMRTVNRERSFKWRNLKQTTTNLEFEVLTSETQRIMLTSCAEIHSRHVKKWSCFSPWAYTVGFDFYNVSIVPIFPYDLPNTGGSPFSLVSNITESHMYSSNSVNVAYTNTTDTILPEEVSSLISKGPNFCVPPKFNKEFWFELEVKINRGFFGFRWAESLKNNTINDRILPFQRNRVSLPKPCSADIETRLNLLRFQIINTIKCESRHLKHSTFFKQTQAEVVATKNFCRLNSLSVIPSDKTKRNVIIPTQTYNDRVNNLLLDTANYTTLVTSKSKKIEAQANNIMNSLKESMHFTQVEYEKLTTDGSKPAQLRCVVKDHKTSDKTGPPMRPIASIHGTPIDRLDWLLTQVLSQLLFFIPSYLTNATTLIEDCKTQVRFIPGSHFISLDVINLYPSIPIDLGIKSCVEFLTNHVSDINMYEMTIAQVENILTFISYNYEISFGDTIVKQIKGVPMGARFAPPFAIITLHFIEKEALNNLDTHIQPTIFTVTLMIF